jgi:hypothetical protein
MGAPRDGEKGVYQMIMEPIGWRAAATPALE